MKSECFIIPTKVDNQSHRFYIDRCIESIRRVYPDTLIVIALSKGTSSMEIDGDNIIQVQNPYFSTLGCICLFHLNKYADYAYVIHDSMVITKQFPMTSAPVSFIYSFDEPGMCSNIYMENYSKLLEPSECYAMVSKHRRGCFGVSMGLDHDIIGKLGVLPIIPNVTTKNDFCAMERIFSFLCASNRIQVEVICGDIFGEANPWKYSEFSTMSLNDILARNFDVCVVKSMVGRTE